MRLPRPTFVFLLVALCVSAPAATKPLVVTTHTVLSDFVRQLAGDSVATTCLLPVNIDPHSYDPRPADVRAVRQASLVIVNGLGLEPWATRLIAGSGYRGPVVTATNGLPILLPLPDSHGHPPHGAGAPDQPADPHAWHDPRNARHYVQRIADALVQVLPAEAARIRERAQRYDAELEQLDADARRAFSAVPPDRRKLVTSHDSLQYLGHAYGLEIIPVAGSRPGQEPSARQLADLITTVRREHVPAVFFEATSNPKLAELVASEAGVRVVRELYTDSLGPAGSPGETYLGMARHNLATLVDALK